MIMVLVLCALISIAWMAMAHPHDSSPDTSNQRSSLEAVPGFSWVAADLLAAMARPGRERPLDEDLAYLQAAGLSVLISLTEQPVAADDLARYGLTGLHLPVADFTPPTMVQIEEFLTVVERARADGEAVGIHCTAGQGRTGTMLAAYLVSQGLSAPEALAKIRRLRPGSVETAEQEERVAEFARRRAGD